MKTIFALIAMIPFGSFAQSGDFIIKGKIGTFNAPATIFLYYHTTEGQDFKDSAMLNNGFFELKGRLKSPVRGAQLMLFSKGKPTDADNNNGTVIWLEPGYMQITSSDSLRKVILKGSKLNADQDRLDDVLKTFNDRSAALSNSVNSDFFKDQQTSEFKAFQEKEARILSEMLPVYRNFILSNPSSLVSLAALSDYQGAKYGPKVGLPEIEPLFNSLSAYVKSSVMGKRYQAQLAKWKSVDVGSIAPDFTLHDQNRKPIKLSDFKGKYVLLDFWASWCHPCRDENPNLIKQYELYKDKNFTILSVTLDTEKFREEWLKAIKQDGLTWPQVTGKVENNEARLKYGVLGIPDNFLINPDGEVVAKSLRGDDLNKKLKEILDK